MCKSFLNKDHVLSLHRDGTWNREVTDKGDWGRQSMSEGKWLPVEWEARGDLEQGLPEALFDEFKHLMVPRDTIKELLSLTEREEKALTGQVWLHGDGTWGAIAYYYGKVWEELKAKTVMET